MNGSNGVGQTGVRARVPGDADGEDEDGSFDIGTNARQGHVIASQLTLKLSSDVGIERVLGTQYADNITGNTRPNRIEGRDGSQDKIFGDDGNDTLDGGNGDFDCVHGEAGLDVEYGGAGTGDYVGHNFLVGDTHDAKNRDDDNNDTLYGGSGDDFVGGDDGDDLIYGDAGDDQLEGGTGNDRAYGGNDNDDIYGGGGDDTLLGESGATGSAGSGSSDTVHSDAIYGGIGSDSICGGLGNDTVFGDERDQKDGSATSSGSADSLWGDFALLSGAYQTDEGNDAIFCGPGDDTAHGDSSNVAYGFGFGDDYLNGGAGNDSLVGDGDSDFGCDLDPGSSVYGQGVWGQDAIEGGPGTDYLKGANDSDVYVFAGSDTLGTDTVYEVSNTFGVYGNDKLDFVAFEPGSGATGIVVDISVTTTQTVSNPTAGVQLSLSLYSGGGIEIVFGSNHATRGNDSITGNTMSNTLQGGEFTDVGNDTIYGGAGDDSIDGVGGADRLWGGANNDTITGGAGRDSMEGEAGNDYFFADDSEIDTLIGGTGTDNGVWDTGQGIEDDDQL